MATLLTVESHPPFPVARLGRNDEAASLRHVDTQLARLVDALDSRGFFRKGVLIIVGDHRAMTPIPAEEFERLGASAPARIFAMALGRTGLHPGEEPRNLQQTDLIPSLRHLIDRQSCRNDWQGRFLGGEAQPARFVVRADSLNRNQVVVTEDARQYRLLLDGDQTRWISPPTDADDGQRLLLEVNRERVARQAGP
jgi:membrane-anchored protein YejM (alkaline phosphatase superfamily)